MRVFLQLWRLLRGILLAVAALVVFIEEFGWRPLSAGLARLARWPPLHRLEARIRRLPPRPALILFLVPALLLFPLKLGALALIHRGRAAAGLALVVAAKVLGTALVGRLFVLLEPQLLQFAGFVRALEWWRATKRRVDAALRGSSLWRRLRAARRGWRARLRRAFR
ncbi:MAG TPA: hypothetical protein VF319_07940 [Caldimonas sp.]